MLTPHHVPTKTIRPDVLNLLNPFMDEAFPQSSLDVLEGSFSESSILSTVSMDLSASEWESEKYWLDSEKSSVMKGDDLKISTTNNPQAAVKCEYSALISNSQSSSSSEERKHQQQHTSRMYTRSVGCYLITYFYIVTSLLRKISSTRKILQSWECGKSWYSSDKQDGELTVYPEFSLLLGRGLYHTSL